MSVSQVQGLSFGISVQAGPTFVQGFRIWIDYNNNNSFADTGEDVWTSVTSALTPFTGTITIPLATSPGVKRMRVLCIYAGAPAVSDYCGSFTYGEAEDYNLTVIASTPCTGTPTAGTAVASASNPCPGVNVSVSLTGSSLTGNLAYQWLQGTNCTGPWISIPGAVNPSALTPTLTVSAVGGTTIGYRCRLTCTTSGLSDTSTSACVAVQPWSCTSPCYGLSTANFNADQDILNVSMGSLNNTTDCVSPLVGSQGIGVGTASMYANFTGPGGVPSPAIYKGLSQPFSLTIGTCGFNAASSVKMFIDFNHNAVFTDPGEEVYSNASVTTVSPSAVLTGSFVTPALALTGCTRMRVVMMSSWIGVVMPTGAYDYGETEDYSINIIQPSASDPAITAITVPTGTCFTNNETVSATLCNYGSSSINLATNNVTVTLNVNGPTGVTSYPVTLSSGTLGAYGVGCVPVTITGVNLYDGGNYSINTSLTISGLLNGNIVNDSLNSPVLRANYRPTGGPEYQLCQGGTIPFGQGLTVSGCATPISDSVTIYFTLASSTNVPCFPSSTLYTGACLVATSTLPVLPPGSTLTAGLLTATNLATANGGFALETRFPLFKQTMPVTSLNILYPSIQGNPSIISSNYTWVNSLNQSQITNVYSNGGGGGAPINIGYHSIWAGNATNNGVSLNALSSPTIISLKINYTYVPASFEWYNVPTGGSVLYTYSPFDPLTTPGSGIANSNTPGTTPFYAACAGSSNCRAAVNLVINPVPTVIQDTLTNCEYAVGSNSGIFDLTTLNGPVSAFDPLTAVDYFGDQALFLPVTDPSNDTSSTNVIYSRVTYATTGCFSSDTIQLIVNSIPQFVSNPLVGSACAPNSIDAASLINPFTTTVGADTLYYEDPAYTIPHPNPHSINTADTVYMVLVTNSTPYCSDSTEAQINIISATNYIVSQDTLANYSACGPIGCANIILGDGNTETLYTTSNCRRIASVKDLPNGISLGSTSICEDIDCSVQNHNGQPYVNRHYQITPSVNDSAEVCLYYLEQDFAEFNASAFGAWPYLDPNVNLCITQVDNGDITTPGHTAISIPNSAITSTYDPSTTVWTVCFKVDSFSYFYCSTCNPLNTPLPVSLMNFSGKRIGAASELTWSTSSEINNHHFVLERSHDLKTFKPVSSDIASKALNGNSAVRLAYSHLDSAPLNGHNYYRLQQVDMDGQKTNSDVVDVYFANETMVTMYPNPVNTELHVEINTPLATIATIKIMDATGKVVRVIRTSLVAGNNISKVDMESLSDGMYLISVTNPNGSLNYTQTIRKK